MPAKVRITLSATISCEIGRFVGLMEREKLYCHEEVELLRDLPAPSLTLPLSKGLQILRCDTLSPIHCQTELKML